MMVAWRVAQEREYVLSKASYSGSIRGEAIAWNADIAAEMLVDAGPRSRGIPDAGLCLASRLFRRIAG